MSLKSEAKKIMWVSVAAVGLYSVSMMSIRLAMTNMAYDFDRLKDDERSLREENQRLRVQISAALTPENLKLDGFQDPSPEQIWVLPQ